MVFKLSSAIDSVSRQLKALKQTPLEKKVSEATSNENWGVANSVLIELARMTSDYNNYATIMKEIWEGITDKKERWRRIFKSLVLLEYCVKYGSDRCGEETRSELFKVRPLLEFKFMEEGRERGAGIREKAKELTDLVTNPEQLRAERLKAREGKDRYVGISSNAAGGQTVVAPSGYVDGETGRTSTAATTATAVPNDIHGTSKLDQLREKEKMRKSTTPQYSASGKVVVKPPTVIRRVSSSSSDHSVKKPPVVANLIDFDEPVKHSPVQHSPAPVHPSPPNPYMQPTYVQPGFVQPTYPQPTYGQPAYQYSTPPTNPVFNPYMQQSNPFGATPAAAYTPPKAAAPASTNPFAAFNGL
jgi:hypothetical protein